MPTLTLAGDKRKRVERTRTDFGEGQQSAMARKVRALAFAVDPQQRVMTLMTRTTTKLVDQFEIGAPTFIQYDLKDHKIIRTLPWASGGEPA